MGVQRKDRRVRLSTYHNVALGARRHHSLEYARNDRDNAQATILWTG